MANGKVGKTGKVIGISGVSVSVAFNGVCAFWAVVLPSLEAGVCLSLGLAHTLFLLGLLPEFGIGKVKSEARL